MRNVASMIALFGLSLAPLGCKKEQPTAAAGGAAVHAGQGVEVQTPGGTVKVDEQGEAEVTTAEGSVKVQAGAAGATVTAKGAGGATAEVEATAGGAEVTAREGGKATKVVVGGGGSAVTAPGVQVKTGAKGGLAVNVGGVKVNVPAGAAAGGSATASAGGAKTLACSSGDCPQTCPAGAACSDRRAFR